MHEIELCYIACGKQLHVLAGSTRDEGADLYHLKAVTQPKKKQERSNSVINFLTLVKSLSQYVMSVFLYTIPVLCSP